MKRTTFLPSLIVLGTLAGLTPQATHAEASLTDLQVVAKALGFMTKKPGATVNVALVHAPDVPASKQEADSLAAALGSGQKVGSVTMVPVLVPVSDLGKLEGATVAFVTAGLAAKHAAIFEAAKSRGVLSVSVDPSCAQSGKCVMAVTSEPTVEITVNRQAAEQSQVSFASGFRMLITEI